MLGYLSADIICSEKRTVFRERRISPDLSGDMRSHDVFRPIVRERKGLMYYDNLYYCSLKLSEIQNLVPIAPKQEKNLNLRLQRHNGEKGRKARSKGCLIKTDNIQ